MRAVTVRTGHKDDVRLEEIPDPAPQAGAVLVQTLAIGVCGTDREIVAGLYGRPPPGEERMILGHESLGRVLEAPAESGLSPGDLVAGIVRRPDPLPCLNCAVGEWDMCRNGQYTECGIKGRHGYAAERFRVQPDFAVRVEPTLSRLGVLLEPASILAKAWEHIEYIGERARWRPHKVLVTGAGPVGLLAALMGVQRGLDVHVLDRVTEGPKPDLVRRLGATYHSDGVKEAGEGANVVIECTGVGQLVLEAMQVTAPDGIVCLTGISSGGRSIPLDVGSWNRDVVLANDVIFGSVNANRRHYAKAARALAKADHDWLAGLITRRAPLERWREAFQKGPDDIKVVIEFGEW